MSSASPPASFQDKVALVIRYHEATKHGFSRYARGPHGLDWANQPNPFRRYKGAELASLDHVPPEEGDIPYPNVFKLQQHFPKPLTKRALSQLFYDSLALSAWKTTGGVSTWSLRVNPSSGNLHPTEGYAICGPVPGLSQLPFIAHYAPREHALEMRAQLPPETWQELATGFPPGSFFIALSSIFWREAWKYGERAFRYCNHDVGHAIGAVAVAAATLGWKARLVDSWSTEELHVLLGLGQHRAGSSRSTNGVAKGHLPELEQEHGDCIMVVFPSDATCSSVRNLWPSQELMHHLSKLTFRGNPNSLSREHVRWDIIYEAAEAAKKPSSPESAPQQLADGREGCLYNDDNVSTYKQVTIRHVVRTRRSAVSMDGRYGMQRDAFYQILLKVMPSLGTPAGVNRQLPFSALPWDAEVSMVLFVHAVSEMSQGLYFLVRNPLHEEAFRMAFRADFQWEKPPGCPPELPLYLLATGDCRLIAERLSCHQDIASDGCFSLGMVARFEDVIREQGAWMYPRLFWEAGLLGQLLYLEAHAVGISSTGIGCYFDDAVHQVLGIKDKKFQSLYHFTIGVPVLDRRIMSLPAYPGPSSPDAF